MADSDTPKLIRIEHIEIKGYKGIDHLRLDFPRPRMADDPDIFVLGSANGIGKTSVLECCSLLMLAFIMQAGKSECLYNDASRQKTPHLFKLLLKAGHDVSEISGIIDYGGLKVETAIGLERDKGFKFGIAKEGLLPGVSKIDIDHFIQIILGLTPNPAITQSFLFFHSYRKIQEGNLELGALLKSNPPKGVSNYISQPDTPASMFKTRLLFSLMAQANLFETTPMNQAQQASINKLNELMSYYTNGGSVNKLQHLDDNTIDIRVTPKDGGESFSFDGLSSGQKEIISTLFMIWHHTRNNPAVVMIDEPELHLNAQWHKSIIRNMTKAMPDNQYIIATHSEDIMNAVNKDRRLFLLPEPQGGDNACAH